MNDVIELWQEEPLCLDSERLADIYLELGESQAQDTVSRALHDLDFTLRRLRGLRRAGRIDCLVRSSGRVSSISETLGLSSMARVAGDVARAAACQDETALAATLARLERVANRSLKVVSDLHDMSG